MNARNAGSAKRNGHRADDPGRELGENIHGVLAAEADRLRRAQGEEPPHLAAPPAQVVDVVDPGVDQHSAAGGAGGQPPARMLAVSTGHEVELAQRADRARRHQGADVAERRHEMKVLGDHQHAPGGPRGRDHPIGFLHGRRDRLLDEDVEARTERQQGVGAVAIVGRADDGGAGSRIARGGLVRAERVGRAELTRERAGAGEVAARDEKRDADPPGGRGVASRDPPAPEEDEPSQGHEF